MKADACPILVTGANKGIGLALCSQILLQSPKNHVFLCSRDPDRGAEARGSLGVDAKDRVTVVALDVGDDVSVGKAKDAVEKELGPNKLYAIVNNAGIIKAPTLEALFNTNVLGAWRVNQAFGNLLQAEGGRVVFVSSGAAPIFVNKCAPAMVARLTDTATTWTQVRDIMAEAVGLEKAGHLDPVKCKVAGFPNPAEDQMWDYGLSKALMSTYMLALAKEHPKLRVNACTPGFVATDMTARFAEASGKTPQEMGMISPEEGTKSIMHLLFGDLGGNGWYYGSDARRSPMDKYRAPGTPPYDGK